MYREFRDRDAVKIPKRGVKSGGLVTSSRFCDGWIEVDDCGWLPLQLDGEILFLAADSKFLASNSDRGKDDKSTSEPKEAKTKPLSGWLVYNDGIAFFPKVSLSVVGMRVYPWVLGVCVCVKRLRCVSSPNLTFSYC